ncbi:MAG TPA: glycosyltransferase family A protein [Gaiellaceae bacterium]|nr:glycosyltransferase family A protein [Gaiellaceae bacterium]
MSATDTPGAPRVTVVTPVYNVVKYLPETVASLEAQTYSGWELVIVDDGSTDPAAVALLDGYRGRGFTVIRQEDSGLAAARNTGIAAGTGEYLVMLDPDNKLAPTFLERTIERLDATPEAGVAVTGLHLFGAVRGKAMPPPCDIVSLLCTNVIGPYGLTRRTSWEQVGGFPTRADADIDGMDDWSFAISVLERGWTWTVVPEYLFYHRVRRGSFAARNRQPERRQALLRELIRLHEDTYREHHVDVFLHQDAKIRRLESTGPAARLRRLLRRF